MTLQIQLYVKYITQFVKDVSQLSNCKCLTLFVLLYAWSGRSISCIISDDKVSLIYEFNIVREVVR